MNAQKYKRFFRERLYNFLFSVCQVLNDGATTIIDFTYSPWTELKALTTAWRIPYYHMDISISSYLAALSSYLREKDAIDAALIFQSEKGKFFCFSS